MDGCTCNGLMNKLHLLIIISLLARKLTVHVPQETVVAIEGSYVNLTCEFYNYNIFAGILWTKLSTYTAYNTAIDQV